jgi:hypothetical protein
MFYKEVNEGEEAPEEEAKKDAEEEIYLSFYMGYAEVKEEMKTKRKAVWEPFSKEKLKLTLGKL